MSVKMMQHRGRFLSSAHCRFSVWWLDRMKPLLCIVCAGLSALLTSLCCSSVGAGAAEGGVDTAVDLHSRNVQHDRWAWHGGVERDPPQDWDDVECIRPRLPRPKLPGQRSGRAGSTRSNWGLPEKRHASATWARVARETLPEIIICAKQDRQ